MGQGESREAFMVVELGLGGLDREAFRGTENVVLPSSPQKTSGIQNGLQWDLGFRWTPAPCRAGEGPVLTSSG